MTLSDANNISQKGEGASPADHAKTAFDNIAEFEGDGLDAYNADVAANAGVKDAAFINYAAAMEAYEARDDVEPLAERRARDNGDDFDAAAFMREVEDGGTSSAP